MGRVLAGAAAAVRHPAARLYLPESRATDPGPAAAPVAVCGHRTAHILGLQSMVDRCRGRRLSANQIQQLGPSEAEALFSDTQLGFTARCQVETIGFLTRQIRSIEKAVWPKVKLRPEFEILLTMPGIGKILGLTIMLEVGDIRRFAKTGNYASYCRCVKSQRLSDTKK
jgi:transposase